MRHICLSLACVACIALLLVHGLAYGKETYMSSAACSRPTLLDGFLSPLQCTSIIEAAESIGFVRSPVADPKAPISHGRTSFQMFLPLDHPAVLPIVALVEERTGTSRTHYEDLQVVRYTADQKYEAHYDTAENTPETEVRTDTVLMYLNEKFTGGATSFPTARITVSPQTGLAVWWKNVDANGDVLPCGFHAAEPVSEGVKYACTIWIRKTPFIRLTHPPTVAVPQT
jgi:prolyl 4-hydroxylase